MAARGRWVRGIAVATLLGVLGGFVLMEREALGQARRTLYWGRSGSDVCLVQRTLKNWGFYKGAVDCFYGYRTFTAVRAFQRKSGLRADGIVGGGTWASLGFPSAARTSTASRGAAGPAVSRSDDMTLLARVITGEAQGEPYEGQVAVGAVILNRTRSPSFPNSLSGVIFQPHAFESVSNGLVWARAPSATALQAAAAALSGWDPTGGSLFFWNPSKPVSPWIWSRNIIVRLGQHVFAQ